MTPETRESLIARLPKHADSVAWGEFVELYEPLIYGIARRHGLQPNDASDLVQEVFASVAETITRFEADPSRGRFRTWLFRVARNHTLNRLRMLRRDQAASLGSGHGDLQRFSDDQDHQAEFDMAYRRRAFRWAARRVRDQVHSATWSAFARTAINGENPTDVARDLGVEVGSIYLSRSRIMARLRRMIDDISDESLLDEDNGNIGAST